MALSAPTGAASAALTAAVTDRAGISLDEVMAQAALQTRVDRKFLLTPQQFASFADRLGQRFSVLDIDGRRVFGYESTYFDTPDFEQYRAHRQGRRRRYKVRSRSYMDTGLSMFEVKTKGVRGATVKHRMRQPRHVASHLTPSTAAFLAEVLEREYAQPVPDLQPVLESAYRRATFVDPVGAERVTADVELRYGTGNRQVLGPELIVVETKTAHGRGRCDQALAELGLREVSMSKYCIGVALLNPQLPANRWARLLRQHFYPATSR